MKRRVALKVVGAATGATLGAAAFARALAPLAQLRDDLDMQDFLQRNYRELSESEVAELIAVWKPMLVHATVATTSPSATPCRLPGSSLATP